MKKNTRVSAWAAVVTVLTAARPIPSQVARQDEAAAQIAAFWSKKIAHCSSSDWYIGYNSGAIQHLRNAHWTVQPQALSQADLANGLQWHGSTLLQASQSRYYMSADGGWKPWEEGIGFGAYGVEATKKNGTWTFSPSIYGAVNQMFALPCNRVPRDPTAQELQQARQAQVSQVCATALNPGRFIGAVQAFLDAGGNPNTCKDSDGRNLLMILPMQNRWQWDGEAMGIINSGRIDLNAKDRFGNPALFYVLIRCQIVLRESPGYFQSYAAIADAMINRGADKKPYFTSDGSRVDWSKIPSEFPHR